MASQTAKSREFITIPMTFISGDFTTHTFNETATGIGTNATWSYKKLGNFYFDFWCASGGGGIKLLVGGDSGGGSIAADIEATFDHLATFIGVTPTNYFYDQECNGTGSTGSFFTWDGAQYNNATGNNNYVANGFLAN